MEQTTSKSKKIHSSVSEFKNKYGLDKIPVIHPPIKIKKDGKHLYKVCGYSYPLRPETIERLNIPPQKILFEVDRDEWHREMDEAKEKQDITLDQEDYPWGFEE